MAFRLFLASLLTIPGTVNAETYPDNDQWWFAIKPLYIWFVGLEGSTTLQPPSGGGGGGAQGIFEDSKLTGAFSFHFETGKNKWGILSDYLYAEYSNNNVQLNGTPVEGQNRLTMHIAELGATYQLWQHDRFLLEGLAGVRYLHVNNRLQFNGNQERVIEDTVNVWDGFGGLRLSGNFTETISAYVRADVGGGSSDLVWNVLAAVDWRFIDWGSVYAGYHVLDYDFSENNIGINLRGKGPTIGLGFYW